MLGFFSSAKPDHPLADAKEARRELAALAGMEPDAAVDLATVWCDALVAEQGFKPDQRFDRLLQLDEAALPPARRVARDYFGAARLSRAQESRLWQLLHDYLAAVARGYEHCWASCEAKEKGSEPIKAQLPLLHARLLAAYAARLKWAQLHYGPVDGALWAAAGRVYLAAVSAGHARQRLTLYAGAESSAEAEYLKLLVLNASSMGNLLPVEIEIAERLVAHFLPLVVFTAEIRPENVYWVDLDKPLPPTRLAKLPEVAPTLRFFSTGKAAEAAAELRERCYATQGVPSDVNLGAQYPQETVLEVLDHLAMCWSPTPPMRTHARHRVKSRLAVVHGFAAIRERLLGMGSGARDADLWVVDDVSQGGFGAHVATVARDWVRVGALVGMQPDGGDNWLVGIVRRYARDTESQGAVGVETLAKTPRAFVADGGGLETEGILLDPLAGGTIVRVLLAESAWESHIALDLILDGVPATLKPAGLIESGAGYALGRYTAAVG